MLELELGLEKVDGAGAGAGDGRGSIFAQFSLGLARKFNRLNDEAKAVDPKPPVSVQPAHCRPNR
jgi:hypothetical protein